LPQKAAKRASPISPGFIYNIHRTFTTELRLAQASMTTVICFI